MGNIEDQLEIRSFLNSFLRDYFPFVAMETSNNIIDIPIKKGLVKIQLKNKSSLHFHQYENNFFLNEKEISSKELINLIMNEFTTTKTKDRFCANFENGLKNLSKILSSHSSLKIDTYLDSERKLLLGHPFHAYPKCKQGMSDTEIESYSPEFAGKVNLIWIKVPKCHFYSNIPFKVYQEKINSLLEFDSVNIDEEMAMIPMHPWQLERTKNEIPISISTNDSVNKGKQEFNVLSSMRSLYNENSPYQLKTSLDIKLTNSIRNLELHEVERAAVMSNVFEQSNILNNNKNIHVLGESFFVGVKDEGGKVFTKSLVQFRDNFPIDIKNKEKYLLASLVECHPKENISKVQQMIKLYEKKVGDNYELARAIWVKNLFENVFGPILKLACEDGILLGAHLQNLIITFSDNLPEGVVYRDCQGCGISPDFKGDFSKECLEKVNKFAVSLDKDEVNKVFGYYFIVNSVMGTISQIANSDQDIETKLLAQFRGMVHHLNNKNPHSFYKFVLDSEYWWQKGNTRCSFEAINETTTTSPWSIYNKIPNPIKKLRAIKKDHGVLYHSKTYDENTITLRTLELEDLDLFYKWQHKPFVSEFWELNWSKDKLGQYIKGLKDSHFQLPLIAEANGVPIGYFETYWAFDDRIAPYCNPKQFDRGFHLLFGEEKYLRTKHIYYTILHVTKFLFEDEPMTQAIWGEPRSDNKKILKFCERLPGWKYIKTFNFPHKEANLLKCDRDLFFKELENDSF